MAYEEIGAAAGEKLFSAFGEQYIDADAAGGGEDSYQIARRVEALEPAPHPSGTDLLYKGDAIEYLKDLRKYYKADLEELQSYRPDEKKFVSIQGKEYDLEEAIDMYKRFIGDINRITTPILGGIPDNKIEWTVKYYRNGLDICRQEAQPAFSWYQRGGNA